MQDVVWDPLRCRSAGSKTMYPRPRGLLVYSHIASASCRWTLHVCLMDGASEAIPKRKCKHGTNPVVPPTTNYVVTWKAMEVWIAARVLLEFGVQYPLFARRHKEPKCLLVLWRKPAVTKHSHTAFCLLPTH